MKKFGFVLVAATLWCASAFAQIDGREMFTINFSNLSVIDTFAGNITTPSGGNNQIFDLSNQFSTTGLFNQVWTTLPMSAIPAGAVGAFPDAQFATREPSKTGPGIFRFYKSTQSGTLYSGSFNPNDPDPLRVFDKKARRYPATISFPGNNPVNDTIRYTQEHSSSPCFPGNPIRDSLTYFHKSTPIGDGQLITPAFTKDDVVLLKEEITERSRQWFDTDGNGSFDSLVCENVRYYNTYRYIEKTVFSSQLLVVLHTDIIDSLTSTGDTTEIDWGWYAEPQMPGNVSGTVTDSLGNPINSGIAWLYRHNSNFNRDERVGKTPLDGNGNFTFEDVPPDQYRIAIRPNFTQFPGALTTYFGNLAKWGASPIINVNGDTSGLDIELLFLSNAPTGARLSGTIGLLWETNKTGDPVPGIDIIVEKNPAGTPSVATQSLAAPLGTYEFSNVEPGNYTMFVDVCGVPMASTYTFDITSTNEQMGALDFTITLDSIFADFPTGIRSIQPLPDLPMDIFPNPLSAESQLRYTLDEPGEVTLSITDLLGRDLQVQNLGKQAFGDHVTPLNPEALNLSPGIYLLTLDGPGVRGVRRIVVPD